MWDAKPWKNINEQKRENDRHAKDVREKYELSEDNEDHRVEFMTEPTEKVEDNTGLKLTDVFQAMSAQNE